MRLVRNVLPQLQTSAWVDILGLDERTHTDLSKYSSRGCQPRGLCTHALPNASWSHFGCGL
jgi:hypothetical protein